MSLLSEAYSSGREGAAGKETWRRRRGKKKRERRARALAVCTLWLDVFLLTLTQMRN